MRAILNVSLPEKEKQKITRRAKKTKMTISSYIIYAVKMEQSLIQEDELVEMAEKAEKNYREGKTKELKSLSDLIN